MKIFSIDIEEETLVNKKYKKKVYLDGNMKVTLMSLKPGEKIPLEIHKHTTQFIRIEYGYGTLESGTTKVQLSDGIVAVIPEGTKHVVYNRGNDYLKLYSVYAGGNVENP
ncbi:cupin domain-containing protein [bacterium]|nr:cupin domain-containing protein [bacterium]